MYPKRGVAVPAPEMVTDSRDLQFDQNDAVALKPSTPFTLSDISEEKPGLKSREAFRRRRCSRSRRDRAVTRTKDVFRSTGGEPGASSMPLKESSVRVEGKTGSPLVRRMGTPDLLPALS